MNKDLKMIVRPSKEYLDRMLYYYPVRSMVLSAVKNAVLLDVDNTKSCEPSVYDPSQSSVKKRGKHQEHDD